ncbi:hypothetical protein C3B51_02090 [Pseudoalteromonas rubra]|uniref:Uncharacterized protein n=1 Tax=Pseudoalteromonas rubra TaxID=43658 RepID=A0A4Q7EMA4_9GAMM|nr:hypothetical protein [Pseudoalteromonas rubra]RZM84939.1 hypothetical protein C3B51_02090 [Pseudoalteromonas rubra]
MNHKREGEKEHERMVFAELVNFIGLEVYRAAVLTQYPDEYNRILSLNNEVVLALKALHCDEVHNNLDDLTWIIVNSIVLGQPLEELEEQINYVANQIYPDEILDEDIDLKAHLQEETKQVLQVAKMLHDSHASWCTDICHRCMPAGLISELNLKEVIAYVDSKAYILREEKVDEGTSNIDITPPPFRSISMFGDKPKYCIHSQKTDLVPIPEASLFNRYMRAVSSPKEKLKCSNTQYQALCLIAQIDKKVTHVEFTQSLNVKIDLSSPMSKRELELLMSALHHKIERHQTKNRTSALLLAENLEEVDQANRNIDLGTFDLANYMDLTKYQILGVSSFTDVKRALLGLMAWHEHFIKTGDDHSLIYEKANHHQYDSFEAVTEQFIDENTGEVKKGYGLNTIKKGYNVISVAIQRELINQRYGRYQERKLSSERKKALENSPVIPASDLHDNDKQMVNDRLGRLASRGYEGEIKQHEDGSIWVVPLRK